jgi:tetratricopeptide (TPR) repeat protein
MRFGIRSLLRAARRILPLAAFSFFLIGVPGCFKKQTKKPVKKVIVITPRERQLAETHYKAGLNYYLNQDLEKAIEEWNRTLKLNPKHPKAQANIREARETLKKLKRIR